MKARTIHTLLLAVGASLGLSVTASTPVRAQIPAGNGDVNADGAIDVADAVYILKYRFARGPAPVEIPCPPPPPPPTFPVTATASVELSNQPARAIGSARGNHFVIDSVPPLLGPNEEINPLDMILGALGTCGVFLAEAVANEQGIPLSAITAGVEADFDPRGLTNGSISPRIQVFRVHLDLPGASPEEVVEIVENWRVRCPIYTTLSRSAPILVTTGDETPADPIEGLATGRASVKLSNQAGRAIVSARGNHFIADSIPPVGGPNEERNPMDLLLGALASCGTFLFDAAAREEDYPLAGVNTTVDGVFDPRGIVAGTGIDPSVEEFRVHLDLPGVTEEEAAAMNEAYQSRCPIFTTLVRAAPIEVTFTTDAP